MIQPLVRRRLLGLLATLPAVPLAARAAGAAAPLMLVHKDPSCGCCGAWVQHVEASGFRARVVETAAMEAVKARLGVPAALGSCHTAEVGGYVVEGHVPAAAIRRLLETRPAARGLAVPGMPVGSPGMEVTGMAPQTYEVILFGERQTVFGRYRGADPA